MSVNGFVSLAVGTGLGLLALAGCSDESAKPLEVYTEVVWTDDVPPLVAVDNPTPRPAAVPAAPVTPAGAPAPPPEPAATTPVPATPTAQVAPQPARPREPAPQVGDRKEVSAGPWAGAATRSAAAAAVPVYRYFSHLESYRSQRMADAGWAKLRTAHQSALGQESQYVMAVDLGDKGKFLRLGVINVEHVAAETLCARLKPAGQHCQVLAVP